MGCSKGEGLGHKLQGGIPGENKRASKQSCLNSNKKKNDDDDDDDNDNDDDDDNNNKNKKKKKKKMKKKKNCLFCLLVAYRPSNMRVYLRDGSAQTILRAATLR